MEEQYKQYSESQYVARPLEGALEVDVAVAVADIARVEPLQSARGGYLLTLREAVESPQAGWELLRGRLGESFVVVPVMVSPEGDVRYPTGLITLRSRSPLVRAALDDLAARLALEVVGGGSSPKQARLRPRDPGREFLPDVARQLAAADEAHAEAVWLDAESRYLRA